MTALTIAASSGKMVVPAIIADLGETAALRFIDFFTPNIASGASTVSCPLRSRWQRATVVVVKGCRSALASP
jgi:hypothetical protein